MFHVQYHDQADVGQAIVTSLAANSVNINVQSSCFTCSFTLTVDGRWSVVRLKLVIQDRTSVSVSDQSLIFGSKVLENETRIDQSGVCDGSKIVLAVIQPQQLVVARIFIKTLFGKTHTVVVPSSVRVGQLKLTITDLTGFPTDDQRLIYGGGQLEDGRLLFECGVREECTLHLVVLLRGD